MQVIMKSSEVSVSINTTQDFLDKRKITIPSVNEDFRFLASIFGEKYPELFPTNIDSAGIDKIIFCTSVFRPLEDCEGFKRHIQQYNKGEFGAHFFTARVAKYLLSCGYTIIMEPIMDYKTGAHPDLKVVKGGNVIYVECKTSDISNYFDKTTKEKVAEIVYDKVKTCDQLDLFFSSTIDLNEVKNIFNDSEVIRAIHSCYIPGADGKETKIKVKTNIEIGVMQKPAIIGAEDDFPFVTIGEFLEKNDTGTRYVGFAFLKGGRSISVNELIDYQNKLRNKREQSQKQLVMNYPNIVFLRDSDIVGDPKMNKVYIDNDWLTPENMYCSGIAVFDNYKEVLDGEMRDKIIFHKNPHAKLQVDL